MGNNTEAKTRGKRTQRRLRMVVGGIGDVVLFLPRVLIAVLVSLVRRVLRSVTLFVTSLVNIFSKAICTIVLILMLYLAMSCRFLTIDEYGLETLTGAVFSLVPVSPLYGSNAYVTNSFVDYAILLHEVDTLRISNSNVTKIYSMQDVIPTIAYSKATLKNLVVSKACVEFEIHSAPEVETVVLKELVYNESDENDIRIRECENLKSIEIQGDCKNIRVYVQGDCALETILLPAETEKIELSGIKATDVQILCENADLEIN